MDSKSRGIQSNKVEHILFIFSRTRCTCSGTWWHSHSKAFCHGMPKPQIQKLASSFQQIFFNFTFSNTQNVKYLAISSLPTTLHLEARERDSPKASRTTKFPWAGSDLQSTLMNFVSLMTLQSEIMRTNWHCLANWHVSFGRLFDWCTRASCLLTMHLLWNSDFKSGCFTPLARFKQIWFLFFYWACYFGASQRDLDWISTRSKQNLNKISARSSLHIVKLMKHTLSSWCAR